MRGTGIALFLLLAATAPATETPPPAPAPAAPSWTAQTSGTSAPIHGLAFFNSLQGYSAGAGGALHRTLDGGATAWTAQSSGTSLDLNGIGLATADLGSAAGNDGVIVRTLNGSSVGGSAWAVTTTNGNFIPVASSGATNAWTAGALGVLRQTTTGGATWDIGNSGLITDIRALDVLSGSTEVYAVGSGGRVQRTLDGVLWTPPSGTGTVGATTLLNGVAIAPGTASPVTVVWAVGNNGAIRRSPDAGVNWTLVPSGTTQTLNAVAAGDSANAWAVGNAGTITATIAGAAWATQPNPSAGAILNGVSVKAGAPWAGVAVGSGGTVVWTNNGTTWTAGTSNAGGATLRAVSFFSPTLAVAVGDGGMIIKSVDGGANWTRKGLNVTLENLAGVTMGSALVGWASGANGTLLATADGGETWTAQLGGVPAGTHLRDVKFGSATTALAVGMGGTILKSTNGGANWHRRVRLGNNWTTQNLNAVAFTNATRAWAVGDAGTTMVTDDAGSTWSTVAAVTPDPLYAVTAINDFLFVAVGGAAGHGTAVVLAFDGSTWTASTNTFGSNPARGVSFPRYSRRGYAVNDAGRAFLTLDAGSTWTMESTGAAGALRAAAFPCQTLGWVAGDGGAIFQRSDAPPRLSFPPHVGTPHTYQPPLIDGFINPELTEGRRPDTGWDRSAQVAYANGTTQPPVTLQGLRHNGGGYLYLSFEARVDDAWDDDDTVVILLRDTSVVPRAEHTAGDRKIVISPVSTGTGSPAGAIVAPGYVAPSYTNNENGAPRAMDLYAWNTGTGQWASIPASPEVQVKVRSWIPTAGSYSWSIELRLPTTNAVYSQWINLSTTGDFLFSAYVLQKKVGGVMEASWPRDLLVSGPADVVTASFPACDWGTAKLGTAADATGVRVKPQYWQNLGANTSGGTGTLLREINGTGTNTFVANVQNDSDTAADNVTATFRIANWGVNGGDATTGAWTLVPTTGGSNPTAAATVPAISGTTPGEFRFTFDWALTTTEKAAYAAPNDHQCVQVTLDSTNNVNFVERSVWVNMDYVPSSVFKRPATVSAKGFGHHGVKPGGVQRFYLHLTASRFDFAPARVPLDTVPPPDAKRDGQSERKDDHPYYSGENQKRVRLTKFFPTLTSEKGPVGHYIMEAHGYRETANTVNIRGRVYPILEKVNGFGYVARHGNAVEDWTSGLSGAVVKKLSPHLYQVDVPVNGSVLIDTGLESLEIGASGLGGGLFGLMLLILIFLLIIFWFLKKQP